MRGLFTPKKRNLLPSEEVVNFTREPIIETVITPREGCKLVVRSSKGGNGEDYFVDAVQVVSFGHSFFYRSLERPKSFLVPVSDYEILELKETRMVLKNVASERSYKIGGGKESKESSSEDSSDNKEVQEAKAERKKDRRRRSRRGRGSDRASTEEPKPVKEERKNSSVEEELPLKEEEKAPEKEGEKAPSIISKLFPPPSTLIKESLDRYKTSEGEKPLATKSPPPEEPEEEQ